MSAPWMPLYVADYLADTGHLNAAEHGAYLMLIMHYWRHGGLPTDEAHLMRIARMTPAEWRRSRDTIAAFFKEGWGHDRIDAELAKSEKKNEARAVAGSRGGLAKAANSKSLKSHKPDVANATILLEQKDAIALASSSHSQSDTDKLRSSVKHAPVRQAFETWYAGYPHKVGRADAEKSFRKVAATGDVALDTLMAGVERYCRDKPPDREWCNPATWLNQGRWQDEPATPLPQANGARAGPMSLFGDEPPRNRHEKRNPFLQVLARDRQSQ